MILSVINWVLQGDALLLRRNLLLLLHLKFLMNLLSEMKIEFGIICGASLLSLRVNISRAASVAWHWWDIVNSLFLLLLWQGWLSCEIRGHRLLGLVSITYGFLSLVVSHENCHSGISQVLSLGLGGSSHYIAVCCCNLNLLGICRTHIQRNLNNVLVVIMYVDRGDLLSLILILHLHMLLCLLLLLQIYALVNWLPLLVVTL
jgi:hypothetical protein